MIRKLEGYWKPKIYRPNGIFAALETLHTLTHGEIWPTSRIVKLDDLPTLLTMVGSLIDMAEAKHLRWSHRGETYTRQRHQQNAVFDALDSRKRSLNHYQ